MGDYRTPARLAAWMVSLNLALNLTLIWPLAEAGLAVSTSVSAAIQVLVLVAIFSRRHAPLDWRGLAVTATHTILSTLVMGAVVLLVLARMPEGDGLISQVLRVGAPLIAGMAAYCGSYWLLGGRELGMLLSGKIDD